MLDVIGLSLITLAGWDWLGRPAGLALAGISVMILGAEYLTDREHE